LYRYAESPGGGRTTPSFFSQFSMGGGEENPRPIAFEDNAEAELPMDDTTKWYYKEEVGGPWDWWKHRVLPWVSDEARREVRHMEDFLVRCVVADHASDATAAYSPDEAHAIVTRVLRHATHELFRRIPVLRLGTTRALEAAQKRASSLQLDLVNSMAVLETLRLGQRRRTHVCFALWKMGMQRRKGMEAISLTYIKRLTMSLEEKSYYVWKEQVALGIRNRRTAKRVVEKMLGKGKILGGGCTS
jgi:hypothetical protein